MQKKRILWKIVDGILFATVSGMLVVIIIQVTGRVLGRSVPWSEELTRYFFLWTVNFGMAVGMRNADHASVNVLYLVLPKTKIIQRIHLVIYTISCFVFFALLTYWNYAMTMRQLRSGEISPALELPMFLVTIPLFICDILAIIGLVQGVFLDAHTRDRITMIEPVETMDMFGEGLI
jgi:TRAP-type C4-dicarboxylate transport system permease small subunit